MNGNPRIVTLTFACTVTAVFMLGCDSQPAETPSGGEKSSVAGRSGVAKQQKKRKVSSGSTKARQQDRDKRIQARAAKENSTPSSGWSLSSSEAADRATSIVQDSAEFAPTLVVWLIDTSPSSMQWGGDIHAAVRDFYAQPTTKSESDDDDARLQTAIVTFGQSVDFAVEPTGDNQEVVKALDALRLDDSGREVTFEAIQQALKKYLPIRRRDRREVVLIVISDEAGDDWEMVDELIETPRKYALPIYAIGVPAPFGRTAALDDSIEGDDVPSGGDGTMPLILQGPESRGVERIRLKFAGYNDDFELMDSGFGPFGLERLCRASGGAFLAVRGYNSRALGMRRLRWPTGGTLRFEPDTMRRYLPDQVDQAGYDALIQQNPARRAIWQAARLGEVEILLDPQLHFVKRDEAAMKQQLDKAQQAAAKVAPAVDQLYEVLREGARARAELRGPRWQAGFDLAFGRVCAAKARIDGYNAMLAGLKRGRKFEKPTSTTWILEASDEIEASSSLRNLAQRGTAHLQRVLDEHPGTPWAAVAEYELKTPVGWKWTESE